MPSILSARSETKVYPNTGGSITIWQDDFYLGEQTIIVLPEDINKIIEMIQDAYDEVEEIELASTSPSNEVKGG